MSTECRLYNDLAWLWPMWGDVATEYAAYCRFVTERIQALAQRPVHSLLNLACGGGKNLWNLKRSFQVTGLDLSPAMLALARALNPDVELIEGDMRTFSLGRCFDAILIDDGVSHLLTAGDLAATFDAAFRHLAPGGVLVVTPDATPERFRQNRTVLVHGSRDHAPEGVDIVFIENVYDPDLSDSCYETVHVYLIREQGRLRIETDCMTLGLFPLSTWRGLLGKAGFEVEEAVYRQEDDDYRVFTGCRPVASTAAAP